MIIDKTKPEFSDLPDGLDGEVLLERTVDAKGNPTGFLTATKQEVLKRKGMTPAELVDSGWSRHQAVLDGLTIAELNKP